MGISQQITFKLGKKLGERENAYFTCLRISRAPHPLCSN